MPYMANANECKRKLDEVVKRLDDHEHQLAALVPRVDRMEQRLEAAEAYRYIRVEHSATLAELWAAMENEGAPRGELRQRAEQGLNQELKTVFGLDLDERDSIAESFNLGNMVEWVSKAGTGFTLRLRPGEPSRLRFQQIKESINWTLYVIKQVQVEQGSNATLQLLPDRGPWQRAHAEQGTGWQGAQSQRQRSPWAGQGWRKR